MNMVFVVFFSSSPSSSGFLGASLVFLSISVLQCPLIHGVGGHVPGAVCGVIVCCTQFWVDYFEGIL